MDLLTKQNKYLNTIDSLTKYIQNIENKMTTIKNIPLLNHEYKEHARLVQLKKQTSISLLELTTSSFVLVIFSVFPSHILIPLLAAITIIYQSQNIKQYFDTIRKEQFPLNHKLERRIHKDNFLLKYYYPIKKQIATLKRNYFIHKATKQNNAIQKSHYSKEAKLNTLLSLLQHKEHAHKDYLEHIQKLQDQYSTSLHKHYHGLSSTETTKMHIYTIINIYYHIMASSITIKLIPSLNLHFLVSFILCLNSLLMLVTPLITGILKAISYDQIKLKTLPKVIQKERQIINQLENSKRTIQETKSKEDKPQLNNQNQSNVSQLTLPKIPPINHELEETKIKKYLKK